jgi:hypothetical protein
LTAAFDPADNQYQDWFELYNAGTNTVDLGGYFLTDTITNKNQFEIPNNGHYVLPPKGYLVVWADEEANQNSTNQSDLHVSFKLGKGGEAIGLFAPDGSSVDFVTFGPQITDISMGRFPDGSSDMVFFPVPSPGRSNSLQNTPPVVSTIADKYVYVGQSLSFKVLVSDLESPPQTLAFALRPGAPANAAVDPSSGVFFWSAASAPETNSVEVVVTDDGTPPLSSAGAFKIIVLPQPSLSSAVLEGNQLHLNFASLPGLLYQLEYSSDMQPGSWAPISEIMPGTGQELTAAVEVQSTGQRFYRVRVVPNAF